MTAWLLYLLDRERQRAGVIGNGSDRNDGGNGLGSGAAGPSVSVSGNSMWGQYLALLPPEQEMCCLLNYGVEDAKELQLPQMMVCVGLARTVYIHPICRRHQ